MGRQGGRGPQLRRLQPRLTERRALLISSQEGDRSRSAALVWKDNKTDTDRDPNLAGARPTE